ncbi:MULTISPECIES: type II toxin-antitoxin system RelE family toxin [unclassified Rickettsia]|uniref:type II toxin-antitoxin system RelE family toxin n=1 Tax=unclassified Rickettsia TaxID=114295 RepID=UPI00209DD67F|nr:type II toxin-antitoxin system RelE/ParE family toxin [Rickettsia endosymbiont of Ceutorhynchus assimilis]
MTLIISKDSQKFIEKLNPKQSRQIAIKIKELSEVIAHPHDSKLLKGSEEQYHRVDVGEFRIIYQKNKEIFYIFIIGKRNDAEVYKLFKRKIN